MHKMKATYDENRCAVILEGGEPFLVLNIEKLSDLKRSNQSHCDCMYIMFENNEQCNVHLIELKNISDCTKLIEIIKDFFNNKIPQTKSLIYPILQTLGIRPHQYYYVLVIPQSAIDHLQNNGSIVSRTGIGKYFRNSSWMVPCGGSIHAKQYLYRRHV